MAAKEFIVAIELGSSKMTGIAGQKKRNWKTNSRLKFYRSMSVLADNLSVA